VRGAAIARAFALGGATVVVTDKDEGSATDVIREIGGHHMRPDVASEADRAALVQAWPACDVLVNNAGITGFKEAMRSHDPEHASLADLRALHAVNLYGTFLGCRYAIGTMRAKGTGAIINISSRSGLLGIPAAAGYASSQAVVRNHTKSVALYCAEQGLNIRYNSVHPAAILTPMWEPMLDNRPDREARTAAFVADTPMRRFGMVEEVASIALVLASDEAAYMMVFQGFAFLRGEMTAWAPRSAITLWQFGCRRHHRR
jgi:NAD(P)-dependent dehydrogenase (short-subunit alcohol dehydrogenase family)